MTHYEKRLNRDLSRIREELAKVAAKVQAALKESVYALLAGDADRAYAVVLRDLAINRAVRDIDRRCHAFVARHLPSAGHLRFVSSTLRLNVELERVGDYAVSIAREAVQLSEPPTAAIARDLELMAEQTEHVFAESIRSFLDDNTDLARATKATTYEVEKTYANVFNDLLETSKEGRRPLTDLVALLLVYHRLGRVVDQSKNICEDTLFAVAGEIKQPKVYKILFVDEANNCGSQIAAAIGRKAFPASGEYDSAGWSPAETLDPAFLGFMEHKGHSLTGAVASSLATTVYELNDYHVVVSINGDVRPRIGELPFNTIFLRWDVGECPERFSGEDAEATLDSVYKNLAGKVEDLIVELHGEDAD